MSEIIMNSISLISRLIYGSKTSWNEPVQFSFAHGSKDGFPFLIDWNTSDISISF